MYMLGTTATFNTACTVFLIYSPGCFPTSVFNLVIYLTTKLATLSTNFKTTFRTTFFKFRILLYACYFFACIVPCFEIFSRPLSTRRKTLQKSGQLYDSISCISNLHSFEVCGKNCKFHRVNSFEIG